MKLDKTQEKSFVAYSFFYFFSASVSTKGNEFKIIAQVYVQQTQITIRQGKTDVVNFRRKNRSAHKKIITGTLFRRTFFDFLKQIFWGVLSTKAAEF